MSKDKRQAILEAATRVFSREGFHPARMKTVAAEAGVAVGTIYNYFTDKDDLLFSIFESEFEDRMGMLHDLAKTGLPIDLQVRRLLEHHFAQACEHRELSLLVLREQFNHGSALRDRLIDLQRQILSTIADLLRTGIDEGWIRPCDPRVMAQALYSLIQTMSASWLIHEPSEAQRILSRAPSELVDLVWQGLRAEGDGHDA